MKKINIQTLIKLGFTEISEKIYHKEYNSIASYKKCVRFKNAYVDFQNKIFCINQFWTIGNIGNIKGDY